MEFIFAVFIGLILLSILFIVIFTLILKRQSCSTKTKKQIFSYVSAFVIFPVFAPAGIIAAIPLPNIIFLGWVVYSEGIRAPLEIGEWYIKTWPFTLGSFAIVFGLFRLISLMAFFEKPVISKKAIIRE